MKLAKTLVAVAAFAGMAAIAQDAETAALQTAEKESWIPSITMNHSIVKGYYDRGILWDTNTGYEFSLDLNDLFIKNLRLSLFARLPIEKSNKTDYRFYGDLDQDWMFEPKIGSKKYKCEDERDDEFDYFGGEIAYSYTIQDIKFVGDLTLSLSYRIQKNADIYSDLDVKTASKDHWFDIPDVLQFEQIEYKGTDKYNWRDQIEQDLTFGMSFDDVPYITPNASIRINDDAKLMVQLGVKNSIPCSVISEKLVLNNSLDFYYFSKDYFKYTRRLNSDVKYSGLIIGNDIQELNINENVGDSLVLHSKAGFKNAVWRSSLDYAYTDNVTLSVYAMIIHQLQGLTEYQRFSYNQIHKTEFVFGATVSYTF